MRRRSVLAAAGAASFASSMAHAQKAKPAVIGFLSLLPEAAVRDQIVSFRTGLGSGGVLADRDIAIEYRFADGHVDRLATLAAELVRLPVALIVAAGGNYSAEVAKAATTTIPIVFTAVSDPVRAGLVASFNRPGANITGVSILSHELDAKRLDLLSELIPAVERPIGAIVNPRNPATEAQRHNLLTAAAAAGRQLIVTQAATEAEIDAAFASLAEQRVAAIAVGADPYFTGQRERIVALAMQHALPGVYQWRQFAEAGGLMSYGPDFSAAYRQAGVYVAQILKGDKPGDLPVLQPTKFELVINMKTARKLGVAVPPLIFARADEVIE